jgi:hypothetical protein
VLVALIIWIIWLMKTFQVNFSFLNLNSIVIAGSFLLFVQLILIGIKKHNFRDLAISEFKDIAWLKVFATFCLAIMLSAGIAVAIRAINPTLATLKTNPSNAITQMIGGFVSGMVGFVSAMLAYYYQQRNKRKEEIKEDTEKLWFEISHNMLALKGDLDRNLPLFRRLETSCWNAAVSSKLSINGVVKGLLLNLYGDFDFYNYIHQTSRGLLLQGEIINKSLGETLTKLKENLPKLLYEDVKKASAILFGEMVRLDYRQKKDWIYSDVDWEIIFSEFNKAQGK